jgi:hypothetical protein
VHQGRRPTHSLTHDISQRPPNSFRNRTHVIFMLKPLSFVQFSASFFANNIYDSKLQTFINWPNGPMARRLTTINMIGIKRFQVRPLVRSNSSQSSYLFFVPGSGAGKSFWCLVEVTAIFAVSAPAHRDCRTTNHDTIFFSFLIYQVSACSPCLDFF